MKNLARYITDSDTGPISAKYRPDGTIETVMIDFHALDPAGRVDVLAWTRSHGIDPNRVGTPAEIGYDPTADEWIFRLCSLGPDGRRVHIDQATGQVATRLVRRRVVRHHPGL